MKKRIFVGIAIKKFKIEDLRFKDFKNNIRWIEPRNLHVTLVPPWEVSLKAWNMEYEALKNKLQEAVRQIKPFEIKFNEIAFEPNSHQPRMIWLEGETPKEILDLRLKIYDCLGQRLDSRPFRLHVTLARFKNGDIDFAKFSSPQDINFKIQVESFVLYESRLSPEGAEYEIIEQFPLSS